MRAIHHKPIYARFYGLGALGFIFGIIYGLFSLATPIRGEEIFANLAFVGIIFALPEILGMLIDVPFGAFSRRFGRRRLIFYSGILLAIAAALFISVKSAFLFVLALMVYEVATQSYIVPANAELMALSPPKRTGQFNGILEGLHNFGFALGPAVGGFLLAYNSEYVFYGAFIVSLVMIPASYFFLSPEKARVEGFSDSLEDVVRRDHIMVSSLAEFKKLGWGGWYAAFLLFFYGLHWGFIAILEPLYGTFLKLDPRLIGLIYAGFSIPYVFTSITAGRYADKYGFKKITFLGLLLIVVSSVGFGLTSDPKLLFFLSVVAGVGDALILLASMSLFDMLSALHSKEQVAGIEVFSESAGYFAGPLLAGLVAWLAGFQTTFILLGAATAILLLFSVFLPFPKQAR